AISTTYRHHLMVRQKGHEVFGNPDRPHARATAAVRYTKCLMQVEVAHISADAPRTGKTYLCIHVGTVHINLPTVLVDNLTDLHDRLFKNPMRRRIGNHQC